MRRHRYELGAHLVEDVGVRTGTYALPLADRVLARGRLAGRGAAQARRKPGHWNHGDATGLPPPEADLATMTGNAAQAIVSPRGLGRHAAPGARRAAAARAADVPDP